jgi:hypothetical protein
MRARAGIAIAAIGLGLALAGCGGAGEPEVPSAAPTGQRPTTAAGTDDVAAYVEGVRAWVACLRGHGIQVSDPDPTGQVTFTGDLGALKGDPAFEQGQQACASLIQPVPESVVRARRPPLTPGQIETQRQYARCMQTNGAPDFPDSGPDGYPPRNAQWNQTSADARRASLACAAIIGDPAPQPTGLG